MSNETFVHERPEHSTRGAHVLDGNAVDRRTPEHPEHPGSNPGAVAHECTAVAGLRFERYFTTPGVDPFDAVEWELRDAVITDERGEKVFEQNGVEVPKTWSQTATNVVVSKYFRGQLGTPERETQRRAS